jgi:hypothetical protein
MLANPAHNLSASISVYKVCAEKPGKAAQWQFVCRFNEGVAPSILFLSTKSHEFFRRETKKMLKFLLFESLSWCFFVCIRG